jgi:hypothetical protein
MNADTADKSGFLKSKTTQTLKNQRQSASSVFISV